MSMNECDTMGHTTKFSYTHHGKMEDTTEEATRKKLNKDRKRQKILTDRRKSKR